MDEMKTLREVPRDPLCCGKPMRRMQNPNPATGEMTTVFLCAVGCGKQQRPPQKEQTRA